MPVRAELFRIVLRHGIEVENALEPTLEFLDAYPSTFAEDASPTDRSARTTWTGKPWRCRASRPPRSRRFSSARARSSGGCEESPPDASLAGAAALDPLERAHRLFEGFAGIRGIGLSKVTKTLHPKRPALIPMLDSSSRRTLSGTTSAARSPSGSAPRRSSGATRSISTAIEPLRGGLHAELPVRGPAHRGADPRHLDLVRLRGSRASSASRSSSSVSCAARHARGPEVPATNGTLVEPRRRRGRRSRP